MIDITITCCIEYEQLKFLLPYLKLFLGKEDNINIVIDESNTTDDVVNLIKTSKVNYILNKFINFNDLFDKTRQMCKSNVILALCPDEIPSIPLLLYAKYDFINTPYNLIGIPRINMFTNLTEERAKTMYTGFRKQTFLLEEPKNELGWHCWPDYQYRLYKNSNDIKMDNGIHSGVNSKNVANLPADPRFALLHVKTVEHQERMLKLYDKMGAEV